MPRAMPHSLSRAGTPAADRDRDRDSGAATGSMSMATELIPPALAAPPLESPRKPRRGNRHSGRTRKRKDSLGKRPSSTDPAGRRRSDESHHVNKTELRALFGRARLHYSERKQQTKQAQQTEQSNLPMRTLLRLAFDAILSGLRGHMKVRNLLCAWLRDVRVKRAQQEQERIEPPPPLCPVEQGAVFEEQTVEEKLEAEFNFLRLLVSENDDDDPVRRKSGEFFKYVNSMGVGADAKEKVMELALSLKATGDSFAELRERCLQRLEGLISTKSDIDSSISNADARVQEVEKQVNELKERLADTRRKREQEEAEALAQAQAQAEQDEELQIQVAEVDGEERGAAAGEPHPPAQPAPVAGRLELPPELVTAPAASKQRQVQRRGTGTGAQWIDSTVIRQTEKQLCHTPLLLLKEAAESLQDLSMQCGGLELPFLSRIEEAVQRTIEGNSSECASSVGEEEELAPEPWAPKRASSLSNLSMASEAWSGGSGLDREPLEPEPGSPSAASTAGSPLSRSTSIDRRPLLLDSVRKSVVQVRALRSLRMRNSVFVRTSSALLDDGLKEADDGAVELRADVRTPSAQLLPPSRCSTTSSVDSVWNVSEGDDKTDSQETEDAIAVPQPTPRASPAPTPGFSSEWPQLCGTDSFSSADMSPRRDREEERAPTPGGWPVPSGTRSWPGVRLSNPAGEEVRLPHFPPSPDLCWELLNPNSIEAVREERRRLARGDRLLHGHVPVLPRHALPELEEPRYQRPARPFNGPALMPSTPSRRPQALQQQLNGQRGGSVTPRSTRSTPRGGQTGGRETPAKAPCGPFAAAWRRRFVFIQEAPTKKLFARHADTQPAQLMAR